MTYLELAQHLGCSPSGLPAGEVSAITEDSRRVTAGAVFAATQGEHADGHDFAGQARAKGARLILGERSGLKELEGLPYLRVSNTRMAVGTIAHAIRGNPSQSLTVIGVTGTNGKSSTVYLIHHILEAAGHRPAQFGTLGYVVGDTTFPAKHTTPFAEDLAEFFSRAKDAGHTHIVMEVSSHAIHQHRVAGVDFDAALFTNLTQDHLDYHADMEAYFQAKLALFEQIEGPGRFVAVNLEDPYAIRIQEKVKVPCHTYGKGGDCHAADVRIEPKRTHFRLVTPWGNVAVEMHLIGRHNILNALGAAAVCGGLEVSVEAIAQGIESVASIPGRFQAIDAGQGFQVVVDYAHTEDGLRNALAACREVCAGRIIAVFGCGGDRDKGKRPQMAAAAANLADYAIITSDNPRTEDPARILLDIEVGFQRLGKKKEDDYLVILDRAEAIARGITLAKPGDLVLIAGKGHEDYQILGTERVHFDDRETARAVLEAL